MTITIILKHFQSKQHILCLTFQHIYHHNRYQGRLQCQSAQHFCFYVFRNRLMGGGVRHKGTEWSVYMLYGYML